MRKAVTILSMTTAAFAASTLYLARELYLRDSDPAIDSPGASAGAAAPISTSPWAATRHAPPASRESVASPVDMPLPNQNAPASVPAPGPALVEKKDDPSDLALQFARRFLARYDDPNQHAALLDEARAGIRQKYALLKERLKLSDTSFEQLVTILAEENLQQQERFSRCAVDPACDPRDPSRNVAPDDRSQELLALLGPGHMEDFEQYRRSIGERDSVAMLRGRLSDANFLPEAQAERLIRALSDTRQQYGQEVAQRGQDVRGWGTQSGMLMYTDGGSVEQNLAEATAYSQRLRQRAAGILTPAQYAVFVQMQEELLAQMANYLRPPAQKGTKGSKLIVQSG